MSAAEAVMTFMVDAGRLGTSPLKFRMGVGPFASNLTTKMPVFGCAAVHCVMALVNCDGVAASAEPADRTTVATVTDVRKRLMWREFTTAATIAGRREIPTMNVVDAEASPHAVRRSEGLRRGREGDDRPLSLRT